MLRPLAMDPSWDLMSFDERSNSVTLCTTLALATSDSSSLGRCSHFNGGAWLLRMVIAGE